MAPIVDVQNLAKRYADGFEALKGVSLSIEEGEILALLGPNGAGKTTLISTLCGISEPFSGHATIGGHDVQKNYRQARQLVGLVPQEISLEPFEKVMDTVRYTRGLFGMQQDPGLLEDVLRKLTLWEKRDTRTTALSGGMKRRVMIAKALYHEPRVLFLDEPTAGVDVELRRDVWNIVADLKADGVTIILTTHYIEEAEAIADRVAVSNDGEILLVEDKATLMSRMGRKELRVELQSPTPEIPASLSAYALTRAEDGSTLTYSYDTNAERTGITKLLADVSGAGLVVRDVVTRQSSLEDIFVGLVHEEEEAAS